MSRTRKLLGNVDYLSIFGSKIFEFKDLTERIKRFSLLSADINNAPETGPFLLSASSSNAIRHFAWTYATAANYGSNAAYKTSDHHELQNDFTRRARLYAVANPGQNFTEIGYLLKTGGTLPDNLTLTRPKNMNLKDFREFVDSIADYSNNAQGIRLAEAHKKRIQGLSVISAKEAMIEAANFYKKRGLSSIEESLNGDVAIIRQQRMSETEYNSYRTRLNQLGEDGYLPKISLESHTHPSTVGTALRNMGINIQISERVWVPGSDQQLIDQNGKRVATAAEQSSTYASQNASNDQANNSTEVSKVVALLKDNASEVKKQYGFDVTTNEGLGKAVMQYWKENNLDPESLKKQLNLNDSEFETASRALASTNAIQATKTDQRTM